MSSQDLRWLSNKPKTSLGEAETVEGDGSALVGFKNIASLRLLIFNVGAQRWHGKVNMTGAKGAFLLGSENHHVTVWGEHGITTAVARKPPDRWQNYYGNIAAHLPNRAPSSSPQKAAPLRHSSHNDTIKFQAKKGAKWMLEINANTLVPMRDYHV